MSLFVANHTTINKMLAPSHSAKRLNKDACAYMNLYYLIFMKKLTTASHASAFKTGRTCIAPKDIDAVAPDLLKEFSYTHRMSMKVRHKTTSSSSVSSNKRRAIFTSDENEESEEGTSEPSNEGSAEMLKGVREQTSEEVSEQISEEVSGETSKEVSGETSKEVSGETSEEVSDQPSHQHTEEMDYVDDVIVSETDEE